MPDHRLRKIQPTKPEDLPLTPTSLAMTPRTRSVSAGQLILARALAFDALDEYDDTPNSRKSMEMQQPPSVRGHPTSQPFLVSRPTSLVSVE